MNWTKEPWQHIYQYDTHQVKRDRKGRMLGPVTLELDDYDRAMDCVNACAGLNPDGYPICRKALLELRVHVEHAPEGRIDAWYLKKILDIIDIALEATKEDV